ncbi:MAG: glycosyltransferase family 4 protein [Chitinophagaceae bacterium]
MRILLIPSSYAPVLGGLQTVTCNLAQYFMAGGNQVNVLTNRYPRTLLFKEVVDHISVSRQLFLWPDLDNVWRGRPDLYLASFYYTPTTLLSLIGLVRDLRPQVINVHFPDGQTPFVLWLRRRFDFRLIVSLHGEDVLSWHRLMDQETAALVTSKRQPKRYIRLRELFKEADAVTTCSQYLLDKAVELEPNVATKGHVIHNGIDQARFQDQTPNAHARPYILAYGRLIYKKGFDLLLDAFGQIASERQDIDLILAGIGEEGSRLEKQVQDCGLTGRVHFFGRAQPDEIVRLLNGSCFLVVPSRDEPFGIVALEGLAAGKPILATHVGGLPEIVSVPGNLLVEPTVEGLVNGLHSLLAQKPHWPAIGQNNRLRAEQFTWERATTRYMEIYQ